MKFYIVGDERGAVLACKTTARDAKGVLLAHVTGRPEKGGTVTMIDVPVTAESIRLLLGQCGGYATAFREVFEINPER